LVVICSLACLIRAAKYPVSQKHEPYSWS